jgi:hypothetical protein
MHTYSEAFELATMCAQTRSASTKQVAQELWKMEQEYQAEAAKLDGGRMPVRGTSLPSICRGPA